MGCVSLLCLRRTLVPHSLPLDGSRRVAGDVVDDAVDAADFGYDFVCLSVWDTVGRGSSWRSCHLPNARRGWWIARSFVPVRS
jgi:hypothetical protein